MPETVLRTKLYVPPLRPNLVHRPRLIARMREGLHRKLTLISAPAGFGKTTLASEWVAAAGRPVAWLSLDAGDNDPRRFLAYLVTALEAIVAGIGDEVSGLLQTSPSPPAPAILTAVINDIATAPDDFVLVLDDYHMIDAPAVDEALTFLLEHLPPHMHVMITTREDPQLPLARLRARGQLTELRAADLRFTHAEAAVFLGKVTGLELSAEEIAALEARTEGWIAGLQLAALAMQGTLAMQGREDVHGFVTAFAGDHRYIVDYLVAEVLQRQPEHVRHFLLQTSILERMSGPLCDAVTGGTGGSALLETLELNNLFVVPLDDRRHWYRYHHLFAEVLQAHVREEQPEQVATLHQRASAWYEENNLPGAAIRHALAAVDFARAADLIERAWPAMDRRRQSVTWLRWADALPDDLVRARPVLCLGYTWALLDGGQLEAAATRLQDAERWLAATSDPKQRDEATAAGMVVADEEEFRVLPATVATAHAYLALAHGDVAAAASDARRALDFLPEEDNLRRGTAGALLGLAYWTGGDLEGAHHAFATAMTRFQRAGNVLFAITGTYILADIRVAQGRLRDAIRTYEQALQLATEQGEPALRGTADLHLGLSALHREQGNDEAAARHWQQSEAFGEHAALPRWPYHRCLAQARQREAEGNLDAALVQLEEAEQRYIRGPVPDMRPIPALQARLWIKQGNLAGAQAWAGEQGLTAVAELGYVREFEQTTLARLLVARYRQEHVAATLDEALGLLARLAQAAEAGGRMGSLIDILLLQALAHQARDDVVAALVPLERALALAAPEGFVRRFVDEGPAMAQLVAAAAAQGMAPHHTGKLLAAFGLEGPETVEVSPPSPPQPLVEPLSERELEVLQLVAQGLSNREIGERLFIALNTVKGHNRRIFAKLQVQRRTEAVARARALGLL